MDSECAVCYSATANCTLVCKHAFCKDCIKEWYHKSDDPTCPMCRRAMYFKGMYKVAEIWEQERNDKKNEDVFNEAFEAIFEEEEEESYVTMEDSDSDAESDVSWETWGGSQMDELDVATEEVTSLDITHTPTVDYYSEFLLQEIKDLQKDYQRAMEIGMDFDVYLENLEYVFIETVKSVWTEDDNMPKNLFVSKHKNMIRNKRLGKRVPSKNDMGFTVVVYVLC